MSLTPAERSQLGRVAAYSKLSRMSGSEATAAANAGKIGRYLARVDPDGVLDEGERMRRAEYALRADMQKLARRSAQVRADRKQARGKSS